MLTQCLSCQQLLEGMCLPAWWKLILMLLCDLYCRQGCSSGMRSTSMCWSSNTCRTSWKLPAAAFISGAAHLLSRMLLSRSAVLLWLNTCVVTCCSQCSGMQPDPSKVQSPATYHCVCRICLSVDLIPVTIQAPSGFVSLRSLDFPLGPNDQAVHALECAI